MTSTIEIARLAPILVRPGEGRIPHPISVHGNELMPMLLGEDTGGAYACGYLISRPMCGPPLHMHTREDEWFYVLKGELTVQVGENRYTCGPGTSVFAPRNVPHTWQNCTDGVTEALALVTPPEFVGFLQASSRGPLEPDAMEALLKRYGLTVLGPPLS